MIKKKDNEYKIIIFYLVTIIIILSISLCIILAFPSAYAMSIPSDVKIIEVYRLNAWYCGYYHFGGKIIVNNIPLCMENIGYDNIISHELKHHEYFKKPLKERLKICKSYGMRYNTECWEEYTKR